MARFAPVLAVCLACVFPQPAQAVWIRSKSLEWWTSISDSVAVVEVVSTKRLEPLNEYWQSQEVRFTSTAVLKGERLDSFTFRQDYRAAENSDDAKLHPKARMLLFRVREAGNGIIFWVNLTKPDAKLSTHAPYNNDCKWLESGESVLALVKARIAKEDPLDKTKKRGVIVLFTAYEPRDIVWEFVRTADPEYRPTLLKQLREGDQESAIYNLISYPSKETRELIRPFLKDSTTSEQQVYDGKDGSGNARYKTVKIYDLRQAAYWALTLLGESPEKPEGYHADAFLWLFSVGFERRAYFPHGDWKRKEKVFPRFQSSALSPRVSPSVPDDYYHLDRVLTLLE